MNLPRVVLAGLGGESGKTLVSLALLLAARDRGLEVRAFKKGPDYIDAAWLAWASGRPARNLDSFLMGFDGVRRSFTRHAVSGGLNVIEGNRGLYDGSDSRGTHSTAELAKALHAPVILVVNATKVTRTVAACVLGCQRLDPHARIAGIILNQVHGRRHEQVARDAVEGDCGIPVLGVLPRAEGTLVPERHLGLVTPREHPALADLARALRELTEGRLALDRILEIASDAVPLEGEEAPPPVAPPSGARIGYLDDAAFSFYYPENLEALEEAGAVLVPVSAFAASRLPDDLDALYIGGGFPETHGEALAENRAFLADLRAAAAAGLPIYAECGGLMLLCSAILWNGRRFPMAGVLPVEVEVVAAPQGHGYARLRVDGENPYFPVGTELRGHEFHYSRIVGDPLPTACAVERGTGCYIGRDAILAGNVWASYTHLHALGTREWAGGMLRAARAFAAERVGVG